MNKRVYPKLLSKSFCYFGVEDPIVTGWDILWFRTWHFHFKWFTDCGDWFIYLEWRTKKETWYIRFSSAGFMKGKYTHE